jgi:hypothetical protein
MSKFLTLSFNQRRDFVRKYRGFLAAVQKNLAERGIAKSFATVSRTWTGHFARPNAEVISELEAEYLRLTTGEDRPPREKREQPAAEVESAATALVEPTPTETPATTTGETTPTSTAAAQGTPKTLAEVLAAVPIGTLAPGEADLRWRAQVEEAEMRLKKKLAKHEADQAAMRAGLLEREDWLNRRRVNRNGAQDDIRARVREREEADSWIGERVQRVNELERRGLRADESLTGTTPGDFYLTIHEFAQILAISDATARALLANEAGVLNLVPPGSKHAMTRVPVKVLARIITRYAVPGMSSRD